VPDLAAEPVNVDPRLSKHCDLAVGKVAATSKGKIKAHHLREKVQKFDGGGGGNKKGSDRESK
jgi:hypothetical protein